MSAIDKHLGQLEEITFALLQRVELVHYEELEAFSEKREMLVHQIIDCREFITDEHKQRLLELGKYDQVVLSKMESFKNEASKWLTKQGSIREQKNAYGASYSTESYFIDHKK
ncbi:hypothetical protein [Paenibacillus sp. NPDC057934]|uniref:hypothetical protein n=1 Tax=Paenibacillus sp. NPDC057934 TaxID=3346282 RepID=UPI0036DF545E